MLDDLPNQWGKTREQCVEKNLESVKKGLLSI